MSLIALLDPTKSERDRKEEEEKLQQAIARRAKELGMTPEEVTALLIDQLNRGRLVHTIASVQGMKNAGVAK